MSERSLRRSCSSWFCLSSYCWTTLLSSLLRSDGVNPLFSASFFWWFAEELLSLVSETVPCGVAVSFRLPPSEVLPVSVVLSRALFFFSNAVSALNHLGIEPFKMQRRFKLIVQSYLGFSSPARYFSYWSMRRFFLLVEMGREGFIVAIVGE